MAPHIVGETFQKTTSGFGEPSLGGHPTLPRTTLATETAMASPDGPRSMTQLLQLLEMQLDEHIDDSGYASFPAVCERADTERIGIISVAV